MSRQRKKELASKQIKIRPSALRRLNYLRDTFLKADTQSDVIDLACIRLTGSLEPWKGDAELPE